jgi:hypothetical protein
MRLIELQPRPGRGLGENGDLSHDAVQRARYGVAQTGTRRTSRLEGNPTADAAEELTPVIGEADRRLAFDDPACAQLVADRAHDRDRQLGRATQRSHRDRLAPRDGAQHIPDSCLSLGKTDSCGDIGDDPILLGHRIARSMHLTSARCARSPSRTMHMIRSPSTSP